MDRHPGSLAQVSDGTGPSDSNVSGLDNTPDPKRTEIAERTGDMIHALARRISGTDSIAESVTSQVLARIVRDRDAGAGAGSDSPEETIRAVLGDRNTLPDDSRSFASHAAQASVEEIAAVFEQAVLRLPENYRVVFVLGDIEEISIYRIASLLGLEVADAKMRLHRARLLMQDCLHRHFQQRIGPS